MNNLTNNDIIRHYKLLEGKQNILRELIDLKNSAVSVSNNDYENQFSAEAIEVKSALNKWLTGFFTFDLNPLVTQPTNLTLISQYQPVHIVDEEQELMDYMFGNERIEFYAPSGKTLNLKVNIANLVREVPKIQIEENE